LNFQTAVAVIHSGLEKFIFGRSNHDRPRNIPDDVSGLYPRMQNDRRASEPVPNHVQENDDLQKTK
jgi:hypothetical protein